jgi:hypothetical protein
MMSVFILATSCLISLRMSFLKASSASEPLTAVTPLTAGAGAAVPKTRLFLQAGAESGLVGDVPFSDGEEEDALSGLDPESTSFWKQ